MLSWGPSDPKNGAGQYPGSSLVPGGRGAWWVLSPAGEQVRAWETRTLFQLCPESLTLVQSLPGGSVRPTDP